MVEEEKCPHCRARMIKFKITVGSRVVVKRACSMGKLCERARILKQEIERRRAA